MDEFKYLGIILDNKLSFKNHINYIITKISKKIGYLRRIGHHLSSWTKMVIYKTIVQPHFDFCSTIFYQAFITDIDRLQKLQNRGMRTILKCNRYVPIQIMLDALQWSNVREQIKFNSMIFIYKIHKKLLPNYLGSKLKAIAEVHDHGTRGAKTGFYLEGCKKKIASKSIFYSGIREFNFLPSEVVNSSSVTRFKKNYILYKAQAQK